MKKEFNPCLGRLSVGAFAVAAAFSVTAQELDAERVAAIAELTTPRSEVNLGLGYLSEDSRRLGQYSGVKDEGFYGLIDLNMVSLDKSSGTWTRLYGRNLGLDIREAAFEQNRQGHWRYMIGFSQMARYEPYLVNTAVSGAGTERVTVPAVSTAGVPANLYLKRDLLSAGFDAAIDATNSLKVRFTHETKEGARLYGRGTVGASAAASAIEFLPEPNDRTTETLDLALVHSGKNFQISGGYYGTLFVNHADGLYVTGGATPLAAPAASAFTPMSQPLSNDSHQLYVTGGYNLTPLTRTSFKVSETMARQNENYISVTPAATFPGAPVSLNGRVDTTLAYFDLTSVEFDRIDLQANVRYEDRDDKTQVAQYMTAAAPNTTGTLSGVTGFNKPRSWSSLKTKLEAGYLLPENFKILGGWELDQQKRNAPEQYRKVNIREETDESIFRLELKRTLFDSLNASIAVIQARRTGSDYLSDTYDMNGATAGAPPSNLVNPLLWADRDRKAWKATAEWSPLENLSVHVVVEESNDHYSGRQLGPREGARKFASIDASYALSERWNAHFWWSVDDTRAEQQTRVNPALAISQDWQANLVQASEGVGAGLQGRMRNGIEMGADASYSKQTAEQRMGAITGAAITSLPDYYYRLTEVKLFASVPIDKASGVRMDYAFYDWKTDDWTWTNWRYTDGTTLTQDSSQQTHYVGATYYYRWQ